MQPPMQKAGCPHIQSAFIIPDMIGGAVRRCVGDRRQRPSTDMTRTEVAEGMMRSSSYIRARIPLWLR